MRKERFTEPGKNPSVGHEKIPWVFGIAGSTESPKWHMSGTLCANLSPKMVMRALPPDTTDDGKTVHDDE